MARHVNKTKISAIVAAAVLVLIDQLLKLWALQNLAGAGRREVVRSLFYLTYVENRGAAFGIFQGRAAVLSVITSAVLVVVAVLLFSDRVKGKLMIWSIALVLAGGVGNLIDRVFRGFVVDYLDCSALFNFPVFNFADCCVVIGTILLLLCILWMDTGAGKKAQDSTDKPAPDPTESEV